MCRALLVGALGFIVAGFAAHNVWGAEAVSADFDFGMGMSYDPEAMTATWNFLENAEEGNNSPITQGDFTLTPTVVGRVFSAAGPFFADRELSGADFAGGVGGFIRDPNSPIEFTVTLTASYGGSTPVDVDPFDPGYQLTLELTQLSVYGLRDSNPGYPHNAPTTMAWEETTPGHGQASPAINLIEVFSGEALGNAANYTQLVWDVPDYAVPLGSANESMTRTFQIVSPPEVINDWREIDGLEIKGRVILTYNSTAPTEDADFDNDEDVDGNDFLIWQRGVGGANGTSNADGNANGDANVDGDDLSIWEAEFGTPQSIGITAPVPEPAGLALLGSALAATVTLVRRQRRRVNGTA